MAERLNAHDSKSCEALRSPRVQIPFSAPKENNANSKQTGFAFFYKEHIKRRE